MKILLAIDDSPCSERAAHEVATRPWPEKSEVKVVTVVNPVMRVPTPYRTEYERELDDELAAAAWPLAVSFDGAAMQLDEPPHEREANA